MEQVWKTVQGFPHYAISTSGEVRSSRRKVPRLLKPVLVDGHPIVRLCNDRVSVNYRLSRLVLSTFKPAHGDLRAKHLDNDPKNNCVDNLYWGK